MILAAVNKDHPYSLTADTVNTPVRQQTSTSSTETDTLQPAALCDVARSAQDSEDIDEMDIEEPLEQHSLSDPDYDPACETDSTLSDCDEVEFASPDTVPLSPVQELKFIVFESCLTELFVRCPKPTCLSKVVSLQKSLSGSRLIIKTRCAAGCTNTWSSQPTLNKMAAGNLLLSAAVLFSGNTYTRLHDIADHLNMPIVGETQFYNIQKQYLFPVVNETWLSMQTAVLDGLSTVDRIVMSGDGRCDSPGHCAKYMTYTLMDEETGYITEFCVLNTADPTVKNSNAMEPMGLKKCLDSLNQFDINIAVLTTDRHVTIRKIMRLEYPTIIHQFDVWHLVKSITKRLTALAKVKGNENLFDWIQSLNNHFWWCAESCNGDAEVLREKWQSAVYHTAGIHSWKDKKHFHACQHDPLSDEDKRGISWLRAGSPAHDALQKVVQDKTVLKDLGHVTMFCHTGQLEVYHSLLLKYAPKRQHFSYPGTVCRTQLAAIDHNYHLGRKQATTHTGEKRYNIVYPKTHGHSKNWVAKTIMQRKEYPYREDMMKDVVAMRMLGLEKCSAQLPPVKPNTAPTEKPNKSDVVAKTLLHTRFSCKK